MRTESPVRTVTLSCESDSVEFGRELGEQLRAGDLVLLDGPLGAGKTVVTRGIAAGMGVSGRVTSPTFVLARVHHPSPEPSSTEDADSEAPALVHVDAYRLTGLDELDDLDLDTDLTEAAVVVEWGGDFAERLAEEYLVVRLRRREDETREATLECRGRRWEPVVTELAAARDQ